MPQPDRGPPGHAQHAAGVVVGAPLLVVASADIVVPRRSRVIRDLARLLLVLGPLLPVVLVVGATPLAVATTVVVSVVVLVAIFGLVPAPLLLVVVVVSPWLLRVGFCSCFSRAPLRSPDSRQSGTVHERGFAHPESGVAP